MPFAPARGASLYYEEVGSGLAVVFVHEFAADSRTWEAQLHFFARRYRCIAFNARGYPPSDVPTDPALYGQEHATDDIVAVLDHLGIERAHIVGLSMGGAATLHFGLRHPARAFGLVATSAGSGALKSERERFIAGAHATADALESGGMATMVDEMKNSPTRVQLLAKDPRAWAEFCRYLGEHSPLGSALTLRNYQAKRASLFDLKEAFAAMTVPTLLVCGDEDAPVLDVNLFLKRTLPAAGLWVVPQTGHSVNLEEPDAYNRVLLDFFGAVERGRWKPLAQRIDDVRT
jgi:pimeloyl-ACP methyl ester carboxylesterase